MSYYTVAQLCKLVHRTPRTVLEHISQKWLKAEKIPGARGWRIKDTDAQKWAAKYLAIDLTKKEVA